MRANYPILEFDPTREAIVEPSRVIQPRDVPEYCVVCFFKEVLDEIIKEKQASLVVDHAWSDGPHPIHEITLLILVGCGSVSQLVIRERKTVIFNME